MEKLVKITHIGEPKRGTRSDGTDWQMTDIDVEWTIAQPGRESYSQACVGTVSGFVNMNAVEKLRQEGKEILVTMYVDVRVWNNRHFTNVKLYLPKEYMLEAAPL